MPFLRFSRDKRGYEHTYLVHTANRRGKPARPRVLYWYRTPPGVRVGRAPFDAEMRKTLEAQYPGVTFDWKTFQSTPMPPPEPEYWRERRRAERAAKQVRQLEEAAGEEPESAGGALGERAEPRALELSEEPGSAVRVESEGLPEPAPDSATSGLDRRVAGGAPNPNQAERRRSRRGGRRRRARMALSQAAPGPAGTPGTPGNPGNTDARTAAPAAGQGSPTKAEE